MATPKVTVYSTTTCMYCHMLKEYLESHGVDYIDVELDKQPEEIQAFIDTCGSRGVPCTHIERDDGTEEQILGFDQAKIDAALGLKTGQATKAQF
jgi:glutaredoxin